MKKEKCTVKECYRSIHAKSYCMLHYRRLREGKNLLDPIQKQRKHRATTIRNSKGQKQCVGCEQWFNEDYFRSHHLTADKLDVRCKECDTFMRIKRMYGIGRDQVELLLIKQNGCAICHYSQKLFPVWWAIDHDHGCCNNNTSCGKCVRGILCSSCNRGLGQFKDSLEILDSAKKYLKNRKSKR